MRVAVVVAVVFISLGLAGSAEAKKRRGRAASPRPAAAAPVDLTGPSPAAKAAAKEHFAAAEKLFGSQQFAEAEAEFKAAYDAWPLDGFFFNLAQCERNQGHAAEAIDYFERYLKSPKAEQHRAEVEGVLVELRQKQAMAAAPVAPAPVVAAAPVVVAPAPVIEAPAPAATTPVTPVEHKVPLYKKPWFWTTVGAAAVVVAGAIAIGASVGESGPSAGTLGTADWR